MIFVDNLPLKNLLEDSSVNQTVRAQLFVFVQTVINKRKSENKTRKMFHLLRCSCLCFHSQLLEQKNVQYKKLVYKCYNNRRQKKREIILFYVLHFALFYFMPLTDV